MADFEGIIRSHAAEDGSIPAEAIVKLAKAISTTVGNEFVDKARYKAKLDEIDELTTAKQTAEDSATTAAKWKTKYEGLKDDFEAFKMETARKEAHAAKESAYRAVLKAAGVNEKRIEAVLRVSDVDGVELDEKGQIKDAKTLQRTIKEEWADFIVTTETRGADTPSPPANTGGFAMTKDEIFKIQDPAERQAKIAENIGLFRPRKE